MWPDISHVVFQVLALTEYHLANVNTDVNDRSTAIAISYSLDSKV